MEKWISMAAAVPLFPGDAMAAKEKTLAKKSEDRRRQRAAAAQRKLLARTVSDALSAAAVAAAAASSVSAYAATASAAATADASAAAALAHRARRARCWTVKCNLYVFRLSARVRSTSSPVRSLGTDTLRMRDVERAAVKWRRPC